VISGIFFRTRAGCPWRDLPEGSGNWKTVYDRHRRWSLDGTWEKILDGLRAGCDGAEGKDWTVSADSTVIRAHQHAAGARRALPAELVTAGQCRMTRTRWPAVLAGRRWAALAAG
jgi:transposase